MDLSSVCPMTPIPSILKINFELKISKEKYALIGF